MEDCVDRGGTAGNQRRRRRKVREREGENKKKTLVSNWVNKNNYNGITHYFKEMLV